MPLPALPPFLWGQIFDIACQDDGTTGLSLSSTSRDVRALSASHRYQSVQVVGWRQLLAFEGIVAKLPKEQQGIVNLYIELPSVFEAGYPDHEMLLPEIYSDDESYVYPGGDDALFREMLESYGHSLEEDGDEPTEKDGEDEVVEKDGEDESIEGEDEGEPIEKEDEDESSAIETEGGDE